MNVKSLAGTKATYVVAQVAQYERPICHFQVHSEDNSFSNRDYGFATNVESEALWDALPKLSAPKNGSEAGTERVYHFCNVRPKNGKLHVQILDGKVNRSYGGAWDVALNADFQNFLEEELESGLPEPTAHEQYVAEVSKAIS